MNRTAPLNLTTSIRVVALDIPELPAAKPPRGETKLSSAARPEGKTASARPSVLVVDDENLIADSLALILRRNGYDAKAIYNGESALRHIEDHCPDIVISDVVMPDLNGVQLAKSVRAHCPGARILLVSGNAATMNLIHLEEANGNFFELLAKPVHPLELLRSLKA